MPFTLPDNDEAFNTNQAIWMQTDIDILTAGHNGVGVVSGCTVTAQGSPDMTVAIAAGTIRIASGADVSVTSGNGTIGTADATNPRIDLVSASDSGTKTVTAGTAAASPKAPALPSGHIGLALVYVPANDTTIGSDQITDKRVVLAVGQPIGYMPYCYPMSTTPQQVYTTSTTLAANGGSNAQPFFLVSPMLLDGVSFYSTDTASARKWGWDIYVQVGNTDILTRVAASNADESWTASVAGWRTISAGSAPVRLAPGCYWGVIQNRHASNTLGVIYTDSGSGLATLQIGTTTNPNGSTLDFSDGLWTRTSLRSMAVAFRGRVFGESSAF